MIHSMTAFARCERAHEAGALIWELRSVNHRYLEVASRLPEPLRELEQPVREHCRKKLARGKLEASLRFIPDGQAARVQPDMALVHQLAHAVDRVSGALTQPAPVSAADILALPGVLVTPEDDTAALRDEALSLLDATLEELIAARAREGRALAAMLEERVVGIAEQISRVRAALPAIMDARRERMRARVAEVTASPQPDRLEQELVLMAQKMDVAEELDRLEAHLAEIRRVLDAGGGVGRRLDFLIQELNREANTLASKSVEASTTGAAVELKVLIEQMREQVQNIE